MITFIESGNRIATENFEIGEIYTITFTNGNYKTMCCVGIGSDFVMFQDKLPNALFCLTLGTSETVSTIELGGGGSGTMNYNEIENKPQINGIVLIGNKTSSDLGLLSESDLDNYVTDTELTSELAHYATNASVVSALASKQNELTTTQLNAVNSGITSTDVTQITTNKNNISIEDITNKVSMETGYTIDTSHSKLYKQGKHIFGNLVLKKSTGVYNSTGDTVATITDYPPISTVVNAIGLTNTINQMQNIGWIYISSVSESPSGGITIRDGVGTINNCAVIQIDYVTA